MDGVSKVENCGVYSVQVSVCVFQGGDCYICPHEGVCGSSGPIYPTASSYQDRQQRAADMDGPHPGQRRKSRMRLLVCFVFVSERWECLHVLSCTASYVWCICVCLLEIHSQPCYCFDPGCWRCGSLLLVLQIWLCPQEFHLRTSILSETAPITTTSQHEHTELQGCYHPYFSNDKCQREEGRKWVFSQYQHERFL